MATNFKLTSGKNRALVFYCNTLETVGVEDAVNAVFYDAGIQIDGASSVEICEFDPPITSLNIALEYENVAKRLKVGGEFRDVCVGLFCYDQPAPPPEPEPDPDDPEPEPQPELPSITSLVCDALRDTFGGVYGASAFVVPQDITAFTLEVE